MMVALLTAFGVSLGINFLLTKRLIKPLEIFAQVNRRSAHKIPVPVGGGIGILAGIGLAIPLLPESLPQHFTIVLMVCAVLAAISWWNDKVDLRASIRLGLQALAAGYCITLLDAPFLSLLFLFLGLVWFTNLYNFMDGSDGIMAVQTIAIAVGLSLFTNSTLPYAIAISTLAFLYFNFPPAKIFAGDVASIPLGFFFGFVLLDMALSGQPVAAFILPLYFTMDATITLLKRAWRHEKFWHAHAEHYYQQAIQKGFSHRRVMLTVAALNCLLVGCAWVSQTHPIPSLFIATLAVSVCLWHFKKP